LEQLVYSIKQLSATRGDKTNERDLRVYSHCIIIVIFFNDIAETTAGSSLRNEASTGCSK